MSALSTQGLSQGRMGAAVDTSAQTMILDTDLAVFHGGTVDILQEPPARHTWNSNFACATFPVGIDATDLDIGSRERVLGIVTGFYFKERVGTRAMAKAGIEDLEQLWDAAVWSNEGLIWKSPGDGWPAIPVGGWRDGRALPLEAAARKIVAQLATRYGEFLDDGGKRCGERLAEFVTVYSIPFSNC